MAKPRGTCIFCGGLGVTKEHLFSNWLRQLFPRTPSDTHTFGRSDWATQTGFEQVINQGHSGSRRVRKVCKHCNTGWISRIDDDARHAITPLIQGASTLVSQAMQRDIAAWFTKIAMVGDAIHPTRSVVQSAHVKRHVDLRDKATRRFTNPVRYCDGSTGHSLVRLKGAIPPSRPGSTVGAARRCGP